MGRVIALAVRERLRRDEAVIAAIHRNLGSVAAEEMVRRALDELDATMAQLARYVREREPGDMVRQLRRVRALAGGLGLASLSGVARDAARCLEQRDDTAFAAVWLRLVRVAEDSLTGAGREEGTRS